MKTLVIFPVFAVLIGTTVLAREHDVSVTVSPASVGLAGGDTQTFTASVSNATNTTVTWSVREGADGGAITPSGVYTAPDSSGVYHVVATSNEDPSSSGLAIAVVSELPPQAPLSNTKAVVRGDSAAVFFDLVDGAMDYRVYVLPDDEDVLLLPEGDVAVRDGTYRCAGDREVPSVPSDGEPQVPGGAVRTMVSANVLGFTRTEVDATLGYVYTSAGPESAPVYALGDPAPAADNPCFFQRWNASRGKKYVTSPSERDSLLAAGWRDDGIAFYAPLSTAETKQVFTALSGGNRLYFSEGPEASARANLGPIPAFLVLDAPADGTAPLMRAYYQNGCGASHDELAVGQAMFERIVHQGNQPLNELLWSGLTGPTTLVVEALDQGCPFQGHLAPASFPADQDHQAFFTLEDIRATAPNGEVFVNGQHEADNRPKTIARSFLEVVPQAPEPLDFYDTFSSPLGAFTETRPAFQTVRRDYQSYDVGFYSVELPKFAIGEMLGELWVTYSDWASDTNGKFRLTPKQWTTLAADSFLHVTMEVDIFGTGRRYPQILVSDRSWPVQEQLVDGATLVLQTFYDAPQRMDIELCDHRTWEVNNQCPRFPIENGRFDLPWRPQPEVSEHMGVDRRARIDVYASTERAYLFLDGQAYGCASLPPGRMPAGLVTVTFGDVLYHSGVDVPNPHFRFHRDHLKTETRRHFDEIGFISGVPAPPWDESLIPCPTNLVE